MLVAVLLTFAIGCGDGGKGDRTITVFAAASLTDAFNDIAAEFESRNTGVEVRLNFSGSQRLRSQLELGARSDVFASADEAQMTLADEAGLLAGNSRIFASTSMAVIASSDSPIMDAAGMASPGVKLVLAHESVPAGYYARRLLAALSQSAPDFGAQFADRVLANVVSEETSVKFVEQKVVLGQADAGIVYQPGALTATATGSARHLPLPREAETIRALYPIAVLGGTENPELAMQFVDFVLSPPGQQILTGYGFDAP